MAIAIWLKPSSGLKAKKSILDSHYMHHSSKTDLHIPDTVLDRILAAWSNWRRLVVKLIRLHFKRQCWSYLGTHLRAIKGRTSRPEPEDA